MQRRADPEKGSDPLNLGGLTPFPDRLYAGKVGRAAFDWT